MATALSWHPGEVHLHKTLNLPVHWQAGEVILPYMPEQHIQFHTRLLPFLPLTVLDEQNRPWSSVLAGPPGWIKTGTPEETELLIDAQLWEGDPLWEISKSWGNRSTLNAQNLAAGVGVQFSTRRRNKLAGRITQLKRTGSELSLHLSVNQAIGNCPKYINIYDLVPYPQAKPKIVGQNLQMTADDRLPPDALAFIQNCDTVFLGSSYASSPINAIRYPSHLGMNHRGGLPGFVRVLPSDGKTLVLPDYSGNNFMSSLGNIQATGLASMALVSFETGSILYVTGTATNLLAAEAQKIMPRSNVITTLTVTGYSFVESCLPVRPLPGSRVRRSPYSPPIRILAEEKKAEVAYDGTTLLLTRMEFPLGSGSRNDKGKQTDTVLRLTFEATKELTIIPGQAAIIDMSDFVGKLQYRHMAPGAETTLNDDGIRTWTISSFVYPTPSSSTTPGVPPTLSQTCAAPVSFVPATTKTFSITLKEKEGGRVTPRLFAIARKVRDVRPELMDGTKELAMNVHLVGITGDFILPCHATPTLEDQVATLDLHSAASEPEAPSVPREGELTKYLWIAGGIGITPFLNFIEYLTSPSAIANGEPPWDAILVISSREPEIMLTLLADALRSTTLHSLTAQSKLTVHIFSHLPTEQSGTLLPEFVSTHFHQGRFRLSLIGGVAEEGVERKTYICGPGMFEAAAIDQLKEVGVDVTKVRREGFNY